MLFRKAANSKMVRTDHILTQETSTLGLQHQESPDCIYSHKANNFHVL